MTKPRDSDSDDGRFDYIDENENENGRRELVQHDTSEVIVIDSSQNNNNIDNDNENNNDQTDYHLPRVRRVRTVRFEEDNNNTGNRDNNPKKNLAFKGRKISGNTSEVRGSGTPKSSNNRGVKSNNKKEIKDAQAKKDKTLTQMKFVQPIIHIKSDGDEDDDIKFDYVYYTLKGDDANKKTHESQNDDRVEGDLSQDTNTIPHQEFVRSKRRKLDDCSTHSPVVPPSVLRSSRKPAAALETRDDIKGQPSRRPVTPKKPRKFEIPSSQSPESPGFAVLSPTQFQGTSRSPLKNMCPNVPKRHFREKSPTSRSWKMPAQNSDPASALGESTQSGSSMILNSPILGQCTLNERAAPNAPATSPVSSTESELSTSGKETGGSNKAENKDTKFERTIVYETDAESDYDDFDDGLPRVAASPRKRGMIDYERQSPMEKIRDSLNDDSQELPPPALPSETDLEPVLPHSEVPLSSDASVCYRRQQLSTQFPADPIPALNTQKIAELFPQESSAQHTIATDTPQPFLRPSTKPPSPPGLPLQTQTQSQSQTEDLDKLLTEIVPESSPAVRRDTRDSVIQVESSQPADRLLNKRTDTNQDSGPRGILSRSRLIPSSVMESIPLPAFWMGSQDSVGEPYNLPNG